MFKNLVDIYQRWAARRMFARWSPIYEEEVAENSYSAADRVAQIAVPLLCDRGFENQIVADIGIGTGLLAAHIKRAVPCILSGLDFSEDMMAVAVQKGACDRMIKCDVGRDFWPLDPLSQDMVVSAGLFEYLMPGMASHVLGEAFAVLKAGGVLIFTYMPRMTGEKSIRLWRGHSGTYLIAGYLPGDMESMITKAGFRLATHSEPFAGCVFEDGSTYPYRLVVAYKP